MEVHLDRYLEENEIVDHIFFFGRYGQDIQLGKIKPTTVDKVVPDKYKRKSAQGENSDVEAG